MSIVKKTKCLLCLLVISSRCAVAASAADVPPKGVIVEADFLETDNPGDSKTERSPNARLRGASSAEGVYVESDSHGGEGEGRFETVNKCGTKFTSGCKPGPAPTPTPPPCTADASTSCTSSSQCCSDCCISFGAGPALCYERDDWNEHYDCI